MRWRLWYTRSSSTLKPWTAGALEGTTDAVLAVTVTGADWTEETKLSLASHWRPWINFAITRGSLMAISHKRDSSCELAAAAAQVPSTDRARMNQDGEDEAPAVATGKFRVIGRGYELKTVLWAFMAVSFSKRFAMKG